jgi:AraC-like DNA-binding protein
MTPDLVLLDSPDEFLASPVGRGLARDGYLMWCTSPSLAGVIHWGALGGDFIADVAELGSHLVDRLAEPRLLFDLRDLESIHVEDIVAFIERSRTTLPPRTRLAGLTVLLPEGLSGIIVAGATAVLTAAKAVLTSDLAHALASLGDDAAASYAAVEELATTARGTNVLVARVRGQIARDLTGATVGTCARALRTSRRTLQRRLRAAGTSYGEQLRRARVDAAWQLLRFSDLKIDSIAVRVGFGSASRLSAIFRADLGMTPAELRVRA